MKKQTNLTLEGVVKQNSIIYCEQNGVSLSDLVDRLLRQHLVKEGVLTDGPIPKAIEPSSKNRVDFQSNPKTDAKKAAVEKIRKKLGATDRTDDQLRGPRR